MPDTQAAAPPASLDDLADLPGVQVHETHGSRVYVAAERAYKVRKPVRFPFLDLTDVETRRQLAELEVRLNADLAPGTYLRVLTLAGADGPEPVVEMRRFEEADTLARRVVVDDVPPGALAEIGGRLAAFHATAPDATPPAGGAAATLARINRNSEELATLLGPADSARLWRLTRPLQAHVLRRSAELDARAAAGRWREGHGDLRADHVVLAPHGLLIVDRLEFDRNLRSDDVAADLAFLLMDLTVRGHPDEAREVLDAYRAAGGDPGDDAHVACWAAYRALVSAKVAMLRAAQPGAPDTTGHVERLLALAERLVWRTRGPRVLVVCGPPASGKSTVAAELAARSGLPIISSDVVRKAALGLAPSQEAPASAYDAATSLELYAELGRSAAEQLDGEAAGAIVDATMGAADARAAFAEQLPASAPLTYLECSVPAGEAQRRAAARMQRRAETASDATPQIAAQLRSAWQPLEEIDPADHHVLRADRPAGAIADALEAALDG